MPDGPTSDPEVDLLASIASSLETGYTQDDQLWEGSPFRWLRSRQSRQRGMIGERLVACWCEAKGLDVARAPDTDADLLISGLRV